MAGGVKINIEIPIETPIETLIECVPSQAFDARNDQAGRSRMTQGAVIRITQGQS